MFALEALANIKTGNTSPSLNSKTPVRETPVRAFGKATSQFNTEIPSMEKSYIAEGPLESYTYGPRKQVFSEKVRNSSFRTI
jgi:hypothetical protein